MVKGIFKLTVVLGAVIAVAGISCTKEETPTGVIVTDVDVEHAVAGTCSQYDGGGEFIPLGGVTVTCTMVDFNQGVWVRSDVSDGDGNYYVDCYEKKYHPFPWFIACVATKSGYSPDSWGFENHYGGVHWWYPVLILNFIGDP